MSEKPKTAAEAHARMDTHDAECAIRYQNIDEKLNDVKDGLKWAIRLSFGTLLAVAVKVFIGG